MNKLDVILNIIDKRKRQKALVNQVVSLGANPEEAKTRTGEYNEEKLVLLIYDAQKVRKSWRVLTLNFTGIWIVIGIVFFGFLGNLPKILTKIYENDRLMGKESEKLIQAYDKDGKVITQGSDKEPVTYELMEGIYETRDEKGRVIYQYLYDKGDLVRTRKYDKKGNVVFEKISDKEKNDILKKE